MQSNITQDPPPTKKPQNMGKGRNWRTTKMITWSLWRQHKLNLLCNRLFIFWIAGLTSRKAKCLQVLLLSEWENTEAPQQASCVLQMNTVVCLTILRTLTFLNLVTEKVNLFPSCYTPCCSVHSYDF